MMTSTLISGSALYDACTQDSLSLRAASLASEELSALLITLDAMVAGEFALAITYGADVTVGVDRLVAQAGALDASRCLALGPGLQAAVVDQRTSFVITPRDAQGHVRCMARGVPFRICVLDGGCHIESFLEMRCVAEAMEHNVTAHRCACLEPPHNELVSTNTTLQA